MGLAEYKKKRRFDKTSEPAGKPTKAKTVKRLSYVIQKHDATRLHYDFRLELDGVLKSWAVAKGPSLDTSEKRLAVEVEDHPVEYATFEGTIPAGNYGAGEVIVWDRGQWLPVGDPQAGLRKGKIEFDLAGEKLNGRWVLVRLHGREKSTKPNWLLIKRQDEFARPLTEYDVLTDQPESVKTGRKLEELIAGQHSRKSRAKTNGKPVAARRRLAALDPSHSSKAPMPAETNVQLATLRAAVPTGGQWLHEIKFDGYRMVARVNRGKATLITRRQQDWTHRYRSIAKAVAELPVDSAILDGELVALLPSGVSSFQGLQNAGKNGSATKLAYYAFDLLYLDGYDLRPLPLIERKERLRELLAGAARELQYSDHVEENGEAFFRESSQVGLEGIISKRRDRPYTAGRSDDWVKIKTRGREELVIGGFTLSTADRRGIGALLVGYFDRGRLIYAGRVGTGFNAATLLAMRQRLEKLRSGQCPFAAVPTKERGPSVKWVRPELVAEIQFATWNEGGILRQPSFQGLREDKVAAEVKRPDSLAMVSEDKPMPARRSRGRIKGPARPTVSKKAPATGAPELPVRLTHPERVLYPDCGLTKLGLASYYAQIAEWILPHLVDRPLSLVRCPAGQTGQCFYQKHAAAGTPEALGRVAIDENDGSEDYVFVRDLEGLLSLAQMSVLEIHPWGARRGNVEKPDRLTFDLDPGADVSWPRMIEAAIEIRDLLKSDYRLESFVKTTGGKGLHVVVPVSPRRLDWDEVKRFCKHVASQVADRSPQQYTINMAKAARKGRIFVDYLRNDRGATAVCAYSTRARPGAPASTPLAWSELSTAIHSDHFNVANLPARLASLKRDPWAKIDDVRQSIPRVS